MLDSFGRFITPERTASIWKRLAPYAILIFAGVVAFAIGGAGWEYTNSSVFVARPATFIHLNTPRTWHRRTPMSNVWNATSAVLRLLLSSPAKRMTLTT